MSNPENSIKAATTVPDSGLSGDSMPETIINLPNLSSRDALSIRKLISQFMPTGWKVRVNLPFIPSTQNALFGLKHTPFSPPLAPFDTTSWIAIKNAFRPVVFDPLALPTAINNLGGCGEIPSGISIVQYQEPNLLSLMAAAHRFHMGSINFHIRVVCNFTTNGSIKATKTRNLPMSFGKYNQYKVCPIIQKRDFSMQQSLQNGYTRSDPSMFRHLTITSPWERQVPVDMVVDCQAKLDATRQVDIDPNNVVLPQNDDFIWVFADSPLTTLAEGGQIEFIIENCAGPDFELFTPFPLLPNFLTPNARMINFNGQMQQPVTDTYYKNLVIPDVMPNPELISDGINQINLAP